WLREIKKAIPTAEVVLFTAYADIELAVTGIKEGAADFIVKPFDNAKLVETLTTAYQKTRKQVPRTLSGEGGKMFWGDSP
ncbi:response regulator, partial [Salmonella enterica]